MLIGDPGITQLATSAYGYAPWWLAGWFLAAAVLLDIFDISLPRGDSIGVTGPICAASIYVLGPLQGVLVSLGSALLAHLLRRGVSGRRRLTTLLFARTVALVIAVAMWFLARAVSGPWLLYLVILATPAVFLVAELVASQYAGSVGSGRPFRSLLRGNLGGQAPLLVAGWSACILLLITFGHMGVWSLIPVVALLLLMRQSYALLLDIRETYRTTVEVLVEAAESQDRRLAGHAERSAAIARTIGTQLGFSSSQVERVSYAALLHDIDAISSKTVPPQEAGRKVPLARGGSSAMLEGVDFFSDVMPVLRLCDGEGTDTATPEDLTSALVVSLSSDIDAAEHSEVADAHSGTAVDRVSPFVGSSAKGRIIGAALALGYTTPAVR